jgi:hypothetical protein
LDGQIGRKNIPMVVQPHKKPLPKRNNIQIMRSQETADLLLPPSGSEQNKQKLINLRDKIWKPIQNLQ